MLFDQQVLCGGQLDCRQLTSAHLSVDYIDIIHAAVATWLLHLQTRQQTVTRYIMHPLDDGLQVLDIHYLLILTPEI